MKGRRRAFTLVELLIVIAIIAILAAILLPVLNKAQQRAVNIGAVNNVRQLVIAWKMYSTDNNGWLPPDRNSEKYPSWCAGQMRNANAYNAEPSVGVAPYSTAEDYTNTALLLDPKFSVMGSFISNWKIFLDPGDQSTWQDPGKPRNGRVRSFSMSCAFDYDFKDDGDFLGGGTTSSPFRHFAKESDIIGISPSDLWVFLDEHPDSINDGLFDFEMPSGGLSGLTTHYIDMPAAYHNGACAFAFADCHAELHAWRDPGVFPLVDWNVEQTSAPIAAMSSNISGNPDFLWLVAHTSVAMPAGSVWIPPTAP
ncbi:MAG TPA: prepilin-type N-terminal cleavage/methylation domain-containing protein [Alphaproteobacteria bacterium]|nr:prepilin-type N-terminal cleavage/methylation domain-containing protein [Alphaproteobacteria bacterium]